MERFNSIKYWTNNSYYNPIRALCAGIIIMAVPLAVQAASLEKVDDASLESKREIFVEAKLGGFIPVDSTFRLFFQGAGIYAIEGTVEAWGPAFGFLGLSYYHDSGQTISTPPYRTTTDLIQPYLGAKILAPKDYFFRPYIGGALQVACSINKTNAPYLIQDSTSWGPGALFVGGVMVARQNFIFDVFCNYSWLIIHQSSSSSKPVITNNIDISGVSLGCGLGYEF
ncbi:MAG: hypothetical protein ACOYK9_06010 [Chlamydiia bacterium]